MKTQTATTGADQRALGGKYLAFTLGNEGFALPVLKVREIIRFTTITPVPQMPAHVRGVINLRGKVIPVIDLRIKLGFDTTQLGEGACIFVVDVNFAGKPLALGLVVDAVDEVLTLTGEEIDPAPDFGQTMGTEYILGMAKVKNLVKILLDIDKVVGGDAANLASQLSSL